MSKKLTKSERIKYLYAIQRNIETLLTNIPNNVNTISNRIKITTEAIRLNIFTLIDDELKSENQSVKER